MVASVGKNDNITDQGKIRQIDNCVPFILADNKHKIEIQLICLEASSHLIKIQLKHE